MVVKKWLSMASKKAFCSVHTGLFLVAFPADLEGNGDSQLLMIFGSCSEPVIEIIAIV